MKDVKLIYESPDGGKTLYSREFGADISTRVQVYKDNNLDWHLYLREHDWDVLADNNPAILEALEKLKVIESLCKQ